MTNIDKLLDMGYTDSKTFLNPSYETAIIGVNTDGRVIYDYELMVEYLIDNDNMTREEAVDYIDYNTIRSLPYVGYKAPIVMYKL